LKEEIDAQDFREIKRENEKKMIYALDKGFSQKEQDKPKKFLICPVWCPEQESNLHTLASTRF
jgi:hypothetical protein